MTEPTAKRYTTFVVWGMGLCPMALLGLVLAASFSLRAELGHWPEPMFDDGHSAVANYETAFLSIFILTIILAIPFWLLVLLSSRARASVSQRVLVSSAYLSGWALLVLYCRVDPWRFIEWFLD